LVASHHYGKPAPQTELSLASVSFRPVAVIVSKCQSCAMVLTPAEFGRLIGRCWSADTASTYNPLNPALGQCSVTALVAQVYLGGFIAKTRVADAWHFYNFIDGNRYDFTASQFGHAIGYDDTDSGRDDALTDTTEQQYIALSNAFAKVR
jgi:hypothetical protein